MERALLFLLDAALSFFGILFLLRFYMQWLRVSFANPVGSLVIALTNWAALPLRRIIPGLFGLDLACLLMAWLLQAVFYGALFWLGGRWILGDPASLALVIAGSALLGVIRLTVHLMIGALIVQAVLSWVNPYSPLATPINQLTRPVLSPLRRLLPPISGIDLSPLVAIVLLQALLMLLP